VFLNKIESGLFSRVPKDLEALLFGGLASAPPKPEPVFRLRERLRDLMGVYVTNEYLSRSMWICAVRICSYVGQEPFERRLVMTGKNHFFERAEYGDFEFKRKSNGRAASLIAK
jgi:hypothetical protein